MGRYFRSAMTEIKFFFDHLRVYLKWMCFAIIIGGILGVVGAGFYYALSGAEFIRGKYPFIVFFLPVAGLLVVALYKLLDKDPKHIDNRGTNMALAAINSDEDVPLRITLLIFVSTVISHIFGASVGREGAALQMGASIGNKFAKLIKLEEADKKILIMTGMSAAFAAIFGSPLTAAVFSMEVVSVGIMHYGALVPCIISALSAMSFAKFLGVEYEPYKLTDTMNLAPVAGAKVCLLGILCAMLSIVICVVLILSERFMQNIFENQYVRIFVAGTAVALLTLAAGTSDYNGLGSDIIVNAVAGKAVWYAFILKLVFASVSLSGGYKGGEIVPSLFIGATFGCVIAPLIGIPAGLGAALGLVAVFCGVTNSPIASFIMGIELFGSANIWMFGLIVAVSYMMSGYYGLYKSQLIIYSKYRHVYVRRNAKR